MRFLSNTVIGLVLFALLLLLPAGGWGGMAFFWIGRFGFGVAFVLGMGFTLGGLTRSRLSARLEA